SCPEAMTAATRVWLVAVLLCCSDDHVQAIAAWPTDPPSCVITNANSRLRQLFSPTFDQTFTLVTAFFPTRRTDLSLTTVPPHSPELGRPLVKVRENEEKPLVRWCVTGFVRLRVFEPGQCEDLVSA